MYVITDKNDIIVEISKIAEYINGDISTGDRIYPAELLFTIHEVEVIPEGVLPMKYCFDSNNFSKNKLYDEPQDVEIETLKSQVRELEGAVMELTVALTTITGGAN